MSYLFLSTQLQTVNAASHSQTGTAGRGRRKTGSRSEPVSYSMQRVTCRKVWQSPLPFYFPLLSPLLHDARACMTRVHNGDKNNYLWNIPAQCLGICGVVQRWLRAGLLLISPPQWCSEPMLSYAILFGLGKNQSQVRILTVLHSQALKTSSYYYHDPNQSTLSQGWCEQWAPRPPGLAGSQQEQSGKLQQKWKQTMGRWRKQSRKAS